MNDLAADIIWRAKIKVNIALNVENAIVYFCSQYFVCLRLAIYGIGITVHTVFYLVKAGMS